MFNWILRIFQLAAGSQSFNQAQRKTIAGSPLLFCEGFCCFCTFLGAKKMFLWKPNEWSSTVSLTFEGNCLTANSENKRFLALKNSTVEEKKRTKIVFLIESISYNDFLNQKPTTTRNMHAPNQIHDKSLSNL